MPFKDQSEDMNSISEDPDFQKTSLYSTFKQSPLGFIDIGSREGVHPLIHPLASLTHVLCFDPDKKDCEALKQRYARQNPFANITIIPKALAQSSARKRKLYIAAVPTNTSLLEPEASFIKRYHAVKFKTDRATSIPTASLDSILYQNGLSEKCFGEFVKLDTQGSEYEILNGAKKTLSEQTMAVFCEISFFHVYKRQKTYEDIAHFLKRYGFFLYGFFSSHYRSTKALERRSSHTEERLMSADALFIKDPFEPSNRRRRFSNRKIQALTLIAVATGFYDLALELVRRYFLSDCIEQERLDQWIKRRARVNQKIWEEKVLALGRRCQDQPNKAYFFVQKFVDQHRSNSSIDYLPA